MGEKVTIAALQGMKRGAKKIVGVVAWDFQIAKIADRAGVDIVSVGDSVGMNLWGRKDPEDMTLDEMILIGKAVRDGVSRALVSVDFPYGVLQRGTAAAHAAIGYGANFLESKTETYANVAKVTLEALSSYADDVRAARQIKGGIPVKPAA